MSLRALRYNSGLTPRSNLLKLFCKVILGGVSILVLSFLIIPTVFAEEPPPAAAPASTESSTPASAIDESFSVDTYLRLGGGKDKDKEKLEGTFGKDNVQGGKEGSVYFKKAQELSAETGQSVSPVAVFIVDIIDFLTAIVGTFSLFVFIVGALMTVTSEGKEDRLSKGKDAMIYAIIGLVIALASYLIATFVQSIFY